MNEINKKKKYIILCSVLIVFWLLPLLYGNFSVDAEYVKSLAACLLFLAAALLSLLLPNRHAALISASAVGAGLCALYPAAAYDVLPVVLLCCWLRCYLEYKKGNAVRVYFEVFTDLIYAYLAAVAVRLIRSGYTFIRIETADIQTIPDLCLMALVFLFFVALFFMGAGKTKHSANSIKGNRNKNEKQKKARGTEWGFIGLIPVRISLRTFWGFSVLLLAVCLLQYTDSKLIAENNLFFRTGFRLMFFPWMVLLFLVLDAFFPDAASWKRMFRR